MSFKRGNITHSDTYCRWTVHYSDAKLLRDPYGIPRKIQSPNFQLVIGTCFFAIQLKEYRQEYNSIYVLKLQKLFYTNVRRPILLSMNGQRESRWLNEEHCLEFHQSNLKKRGNIIICCYIGEQSAEYSIGELRFGGLSIARSVSPVEEAKVDDAPRSKDEEASSCNNSDAVGGTVKQETSPCQGSNAVGGTVKQEASPCQGSDADCGTVKQEASASKSTFKLIEQLKEALLTEKDSDVVLKVEGREFKAHRLILGLRSPVFSAMFQHEMKEKISGVVTMEDCDPETFPDFLHYVYTGRVEELSSENAPRLYVTADKYQLMELKEECLEYMKNSISVENFCDFMSLSLCRSETELTAIATQFFLKNFSDIVVTPKWMTFLAENVVAGNELFVKLSRDRGTK